MIVYVDNQEVFRTGIKRKTKKTYNELLKERDLYGVDGPCPPTDEKDFYVFYRKRKSKTGRNEDRLELSQEKPKKLITESSSQGRVKSRKGKVRENIQIHFGRVSKGCILIKSKVEFNKLLNLIKGYLEEGVHVRIKIDDYWRTREGQKQKIGDRDRKAVKCGAKCKYFEEYGYCDRLVYDPPCWQHRK